MRTPTQSVSQWVTLITSRASCDAKNGYEMQCILSTRIQRESHWQPGFHLSPNCSSSHNSFPRLPVMKTNIFLRTVLNFFETRWVCRDTIKKSGNVMFLIKTRCCSTNPPVIIYALLSIFWISWFMRFFATPRPADFHLRLAPLEKAPHRTSRMHGVKRSDVLGFTSSMTNKFLEVRGKSWDLRDVHCTT